MASFVHVMLVGQNTQHVDTAVADHRFHLIKKIYLLHSPDEKVSKKKKPTAINVTCPKCKHNFEGGGEWTAFKTKAKECKARNQSQNTKVELVELSSAFDAEPTIIEITKIFKKEIKFLATKKHFVINVTGGTNMMAVGSMVAASQLQSSAYYVLDNRFLPNEETYLREIHIPDFKTEFELKEADQKVLKEIWQSKFEWKHIPKIEIKYYDDRGREFTSTPSGNATSVSYKIGDSLTPEWMEKKTIDNAITKASQDDEDLPGEYERKRGLYEIMNDDHGIKRTKLGRILNRLEDKGLIRKEQVPRLSPPRGSIGKRWRVYELDGKQEMLILTTLGKMEIE